MTPEEIKLRRGKEKKKKALFNKEDFVVTKL